jgi:hypothetical protein
MHDAGRQAILLLLVGASISCARSAPSALASPVPEHELPAAERAALYQAAAPAVRNGMAGIFGVAGGCNTAHVVHDLPDRLRVTSFPRLEAADRQALTTLGDTLPVPATCGRGDGHERGGGLELQLAFSAPFRLPSDSVAVCALVFGSRIGQQITVTVEVRGARRDAAWEFRPMMDPKRSGCHP